MNKSESIDQLATALAAAQAEMGAAVKDRTAKVQSAKGSYSYTYATLAGCIEASRPALTKHGLAVAQLPTAAGVHTLLMHKSGQWVAGETPLRVSQDATPQAYGSAVTYARRYGYCAITGLATEEDDDGQAAERRPAANGNGNGRARPAETPAGDDMAMRIAVFAEEIRKLEIAGDVAGYGPLAKRITEARLSNEDHNTLVNAWKASKARAEKAATS